MDQQAVFADETLKVLGTECLNLRLDKPFGACMCEGLHVAC